MQWGNYRASLALVVIGACASLLASLVTSVVRRLALRHGVVDVPNDRSSHQTPTPRGGGLSIVLTASAALLVLASLGAVRSALLLALIGGGMAVAIVGLADDRRRVSPGVRIAVHLAAAIWALGWLGAPAPLRVGEHIIAFGWLGFVLGILGIVWVLNLFNFMDGIDGIAGSEAIFVCWSGALLAADGSVAVAAVVIGCACLGFLWWNWPPARIFMGDVGSGYLGYVLAVLALAAARDNPVAIWVWLIVGGAFFVDATVTLARRTLRQERLHEAHRSHAYQWLARRWRSHLRVTLALLLVDALWLLPCGTFAALHPQYAAVTAIVALAPLVALAIMAGAGRGEAPSDTRL